MLVRTCECNDQHDGHLAPFGLVEDRDADDEQGNEAETPEGGNRVVAARAGGRVLVDEAVDGGADGDAEAEEEGVDDGVDDSDRTGDDGARLELEGGTHWAVSGLSCVA